MDTTLLLVDDKPENIKLLFEALKGTGYRTLAAVDGESAVAQAGLALPDLILMDVMMPGIDGFEACRRLKANPATAHIPVIFMTARTDISDKLRGFQAGGIDYLTKPLQHEEVLARVDAHLTRHRMWSDIDAYSRILLEMERAETLPEAWQALAQLMQLKPQPAGLALWMQQEDRLHPAYITGFEDTQGVEETRPLMQDVLDQRRQVAAKDQNEWPVYPSRASAADLQGLIATPVCCRNDCYGVLLVCWPLPLDAWADEHKRWHSILASSLGNAIYQVKSRTAIRELSEKLKQENEGLRSEVSATPGRSSGLIGSSPAFQHVLEQADLVASTGSSVLLLGESGTGKERLAERIHAHSPRKDAPLIRVNCAAIPAELFESEFFGHTKGAFTGAVKDRTGRFELADSGTLFLDEIGEIPLELQGKLLRVLQTGTFERVGEEKTRHADVRLIAATNRDLQQAIAEGRFRADLFYRISVFPITLPPLRERPEDIPGLARHFAAQVARKMGVPVPELTHTLLAPYLRYAWPGNIRELQNEIERAMILSRGAPQTLAVSSPQIVTAPKGSPETGIPSTDPDAPIINENQWQHMQRENIVRALRQCDGRVDGAGGAAELLGLRPTTLRSRIKAMGIQRR
jgi:DNA-binding NtrC family response regulator